MKYRMMWEALKYTAEVMIADGIVGEVSAVRADAHGEKMFEPEKRFSGTFLTEFVNALEFGFACLGVLMMVLVFMGRIAYVG